MNKVKTKRVLKKWVKITLNSLFITILMISCISILNKTDKEFMEKCESAGYSQSYCLAHNN